MLHPVLADFLLLVLFSTQSISTIKSIYTQKIRNAAQVNATVNLPWDLNIFASYLCVLPPLRIMTARKSAMSLSSSSSMLNLTENSNLGSIISLKGLRRLLRNSRVMKIWPYEISVPSLFMRGAIIMMRTSMTAYFSSVTWSLRSRFTKPGMLLANSVTSLTASAERDWQLWKNRSSTSRCRSD